jgi:hypothetical protein
MEVGLSNARSGNVDLMAVSLDIYGGVGASSALGPLGRSLLAAEKRQDKQQGKSIVPGRNAYLDFWLPITSQYCSAV